MFCQHEFEFDRRSEVGHYFLIIYPMGVTYYYVFKCSKCKKEKELPVSYKQYYEGDIVRTFVDGKFKVDEIKPA